MRYFIGYGSVRGECGHKHRTPRTAALCVERDARACKRLPGGNSYSDRLVIAQESDHPFLGVGLTEEEREVVHGVYCGSVR